MTHHFDRLLRETVRDLATDADVITDRDRHRLAVHAADKAHTLRARRRGGVAAVVVLITGLAVGLPYGVRYLSSQIDLGREEVALPAGVVEIPGVPTHVIDDASEPIELVDGWYVLGNNLVLDRTTNTYTEFGNVYETLPSPNGRWVATAGRTGGYRVYDLQNGGSRRYESRRVLDVAEVAAWSPEGDVLLLSGVAYEGFGVNPTTGAAGDKWSNIAFVDAAAGELLDRELDLTDLPCDDCRITWMPSGEELAVVLDDATAAPAGAPAGIQVLSLDGQRREVLPIRGVPLGPEAWSPDGRYVIVSGVTEDRQWAQQIVEVASGQALPGWDELANAGQAQWIDNERFLVWESIGGGSEPYRRALASLWSIDGALLERWIPPIDVIKFPAAGGPLAIHLG